MAWTDEQSKRARELFDRGTGRNLIAVELGVSRTSVTRWADQEGLSFDRSQTAAAVAAHAVDMAAERIRLAGRMVVNADAALDSVSGPVIVYSFGGKDNTYEEHELAEAPVSMRREAQTVAAIAVDKLTKIVETDQQSANAASSVVDRLMGAVNAAWDTEHEVEP